MPGLNIAVHFLVLAHHGPEDTSPVVVLVAVLITLVVVVLGLLRTHAIGTRELQARADLKRPMLTAAELRLIDFTRLPMSPRERPTKNCARSESREVPERGSFC